MKQIAEALEEGLNVGNLPLRASDVSHEGHQFLSKENVVVPHKCYFIFHAIDDRVHETILFEELLRVFDNLLIEVVIFLPCELQAVEFAFKEDHSEQVEQVYLLCIVLVIKRCP